MSFLMWAILIACVPENVDVKTAINIMYCESRFDAKAKNPNSTARGLYQILEGTQKEVEKATGKTYDAYNPIHNALMARWQMQKYGTKPWKASESCWSNNPVNLK